MQLQRKMRLLLLFLFITTSASAQNLVLNSDFEGYEYLRKQGNRTFLKMTDFMLTAQHDLGFQEPRSGTVYAGFCANHGEVIRMGLKTILEKGKTYCAKAYISRADEESFLQGYCMELGMLFSDQPFSPVYNEVPKGNPQVVFKQEGGFKDTKNWTCISGTFVAEGDEKHLTMAYFNKLKKNKTHYFVDDVSVEEVKNPEDCHCFNTDKESVFTLEIQFETAKSKLLPPSYPKLNQLVAFLNSNDTTNIFISGHTDNQGGKDYNLKLSNERAEAVVKYLISKGIQKSRLSHKGYGDSKPKASNSSTSGRQQNRRVEFRIL
jgi:outer membrane protein OmpA-like peptidoglycan-associated protein